MPLTSMTRNALAAALANPGAAREVAAILDGQFGTPGSPGYMVELSKVLTGMADNTVVTLLTVTVPNANSAAGLRITLNGALGDGDSSQTTIVDIGISRIAGAAAKAVAGAAIGAGATAGATGNAVATVSVTAMSGAVGAVQTFDVQVKVARSAGVSTGHVVAAQALLINTLGGGITAA
jgi:hypothetical protein